MSLRHFALVDGNNFYATCEQVFRPELQDRPVVVLGNNDGIVVARSRRAKAMNIPLGVPYFQIREAFEAQGGVAFSSNYALYGDMSRRVMATLREFTSAVEVYSIDEAFLGLDDSPGQLPALGVEIGRRVKQWTGVSVSVGLGPTKTLAKVANQVAKQGEGTCSLAMPEERQAVLQATPVEAVWGIGPRYSRLLHGCGIDTAYQLSQVDERWARRRLTVMGERTVLELRGIACFRLGEVPSPKKAIARVRQFGRRIKDLEELCQPLASYVASAARELRRQQSLAGAMQVLVETDRFPEPASQQAVFRRLPWPTAATGELIGWACEALGVLYQPDVAYRRCGVVLMELSPEDTQQTQLFTADYYDARKKAVMSALDRVTTMWGRQALRHAREGLSQPWRMRQGRRSGRFTTQWEELLVVKA